MDEQSIQQAQLRLREYDEASADEHRTLHGLLELAGRTLDVDNVSYLRRTTDGKDFVVELQWRSDGSKEGLDTRIPGWIFNRVVGLPYFSVSADQIPLFARLVVEPLFRWFDTRSVIVVPCEPTDQPRGFLSVSTFRRSKKFEPAEIDLLIQIAEKVLNVAVR